MNGAFEPTRGHDWLVARRSAEAILPLLIGALEPRSLVDIGCGSGAWLAVAESLGVPDLMGIDLPSIAPPACIGVPFLGADLRQGLSVGRRFDVALCLEVAQSIEPEYALGLVSTLCDTSPAVLFSAAIPGQDSIVHKNSQWLPYWEELFAECDYVCVDCVRPLIWTTPNVAPCYRQNAVLMCNRTTASRAWGRHSAGPPPQIPLSLVHPDVFSAHLSRVQAIPGDLQRPTGTHTVDEPIAHLLPKAPTAPPPPPVLAQAPRERSLAPYSGSRSQQQQLDAASRRIADLMRENARKSEAIASLSDDLLRQREHTERIDSSLRTAQEDLVALQGHLNAVLTSRSWQLTRPARWFQDNVTKSPLRMLAHSAFLRRIAQGIPLRSTHKRALKAWAIRNRLITPNAGVLGSAQQTERASAHTLKRALIVSDRIPTPDKNSHSVRLYGILRAMRQLGWEVSFLSFRDKADYHWVLAPNESVDKYERGLSDIGITDIAFGFYDSGTWLRDLGDSVAVTLVSYPDIAYEFLPAIRFHAPHAAVVYDTTDLHWLRFERQSQVSGDPLAMDKAHHYRQIEHFLFRNVDAVVAVTDDEQRIIDSLGYSAPTFVLPNVHACSESPPRPHGRANVMFVGHYLHQPNEDAVLYFADTVLPLIRKRLPDVQFLVVGSGMTDAIKSLRAPGLTAVGFVEDLAQYHNACKIFVAPLRFGGGMKGKIGESMSRGLPVVTTSIGAEGMDLVDGVHCLIRDEPLAFADAVVELYTNADLWIRLAHSGLEHIRTRYSPEAMRERVKNLLSVTSARLQTEGLQQ